MNLNKNLSELFYLTIIPGLSMGLLVSGLILWLYSQVPLLSKQFEIYGVIILILASMLVYYKYNAAKENTFTFKAIKLCTFISSFSVASNFMLVEFEKFQFSIPIIYLLVPLLVLIGSTIVYIFKDDKNSPSFTNSNNEIKVFKNLKSSKKVSKVSKNIKKRKS